MNFDDDDRVGNTQMYVKILSGECSTVQLKFLCPPVSISSFEAFNGFLISIEIKEL